MSLSSSLYVKNILQTMLIYLNFFLKCLYIRKQTFRNVNCYPYLCSYEPTKKISEMINILDILNAIFAKRNLNTGQKTINIEII